MNATKHTANVSNSNSRSISIDSIDFREIVNILRQGKWLIVGTILATLLLALAYLKFEVPQYKTDILLQIEDKRGGLGGNLTQDISRFINSNINSGIASIVETKKALIKSRFILEPVIRQQHLDINIKPANDQLVISTLEIPFNEQNRTEKLKLVAENSGQYHLSTAEGKQLLEGKVGQLAKSTSETNYAIQVQKLTAPAGTEFVVTKMPFTIVENDLVKNIRVEDVGSSRYMGGTGILKISFSSPSPQKTVDILNAIANTTVKEDITRKLQEIEKLYTFLKQQFSETKTELLDAEAKLKSYTASNPKQSDPTDPTVISLMRDIEIKSQLHKLISSKIDELRIVKAGIVSDTRILSSAQMPEPISSKPMIVLLAALLFGFMLGITITFALKFFRQYVEDPYWLEQNTDISNLAIIPYSNTQHKNSHSFKKKLNQKLPILAANSPQDITVEALRNLRTGLQFVLPKAKNNIVTVLGLSPSIGKSFISVNLAYILADIKRVLLIDGDIRKGHLHHYFNRPHIPGFTEILGGTATLEETIVKTQHPNLDFLPNGHYPSNPAELLLTEQFDQLLATVSKQYDLVLIDTSPIFVATDHALIARHAGTNLLLLAGSKHSKKSIGVALKQLDSNGVTVHNSIYNNLSEESSSTYGSYYRYTYGYSQHKTDAKTIKQKNS